MDDPQVAHVLPQFGIDPVTSSCQRISTGHINKTYKILTGKKDYVLQRINIQVFRKPEVIARNLRLISNYLEVHHPQYLFPSCLQTTTGKEMYYDADNYPWRLYPYITNTVTIDKIDEVEKAFEASRGFALLTRNLEGIDVAQFQPTIDGFHDLKWRFQQFNEAIASAVAGRLQEAGEIIDESLSFSFLVDVYLEINEGGKLKLRVTHNDTKINNILFDAKTGKPVCVIDLDTMMPGYFIYDLGDMVRTFVSPVSEEEKDMSKVVFRKEYYDALIQGYMSAMGEVLSKEEMAYVPFAGKMMTYIMALRFLSDFLVGDVYYHTTYPGQNLVRARNQLRLLHLLQKNLDE